MHFRLSTVFFISICVGLYLYFIFVLVFVFVFVFCIFVLKVSRFLSCQANVTFMCILHVGAIQNPGKMTFASYISKFSKQSYKQLNFVAKNGEIR